MRSMMLVCSEVSGVSAMAARMGFRSTGHTGKEGFFGIQGLGFKATFPEMAGALIFPVGLPRNWFIQAFHKPAQIRQPLPEGFRVRLHSPKLCSTQLVAPMISLY